MNASISATRPDAGPTSAFVATHWSVVLQAGHGDSPEAAAALERLCRTYWPPLYAYVRRKGYDPIQAQDLTQEFFARLLARRDLAAADRRKGRFRSFLLGALEHFLAKEWTRTHRLKRGGGLAFISWEACAAEENQHLAAPDSWSPERLYERRWALTVLEQALAALQADYAAAGKPALFAALQPLLTSDDEALSRADLAARLGMSEGALRVALHRLRQRYGECVRAELARLVARPEEIEEELRHLLAALS
jgi:RNA polymerase sigma-70 factor (ECF subfamily)